MRGRRCGRGHTLLRQRVKAVLKERLERERIRKEKEEKEKKHDA